MSQIAWRALGGVQAGVIGGIAMLAFLAAASMLRHHVWWETPNLIGSTFYGTRAFYGGPGRVTIAGGALHLVMSGVLGILFVSGFGGLRRRSTMMLLGVVAGLGWYYVAHLIVWPRMNPLVPVYSWPPAVLAGHLLFGMCLGAAPRQPREVEPVPPPLDINRSAAQSPDRP